MVNKTLTSIVFAGALAASPFVYSEDSKLKLDTELLDKYGLSKGDYVVLNDKESSEIRGSPNSIKNTTGIGLKLPSYVFITPIGNRVYATYQNSKK